MYDEHIAKALDLLTYIADTAETPEEVATAYRAASTHALVSIAMSLSGVRDRLPAKNVPPGRRPDFLGGTMTTETGGEDAR